MVDLLDSYILCVRFVTQQGGNSVNLRDIHSLQYWALHLLKDTYTHCKVRNRNKGIKEMNGELL